MKILITGAGGFIARNVAEWLCKNSNYTILGTYRNNKPQTVEFECIECDLYRDSQKIINLEYDAVIHFASQLYAETIKTFLDNTVQVTRNVIDIAQYKGIKKFIYISSISVCGETEGVISENSKRINQNDYELTKWIGERLLEDSDIEEKVVIRLPRVLGKEIDYSASWLPNVSYRIMKNQIITYYNPHLQYNALIHTDGLAQFILHVLNSSQFDSGTYMLGAQNSLSILDILEILKRELHSKSELIEITAKGINRCSLIDITKAKNAGFLPDTVENTLRKYVNDMKGDSKNACM